MSGPAVFRMKSRPWTLRTYLLAGAFVITVPLVAATFAGYQIAGSQHGVVELTVVDAQGVHRQSVVLYVGRKESFKNIVFEDQARWVSISVSEFRNLNGVIADLSPSHETRSFQADTLTVFSQWLNPLAEGLPRFLSIPAPDRPRFLARLAGGISRENASVLDRLSQLADKDLSAP